MIKKFRLTILAIFVMFGYVLNAQVTTSSISGKVSDKSNTVVGATVVATHTPSGTFYGTTTNADGLYNLTGLRVGGPYTITVSYIGYAKNITENVTLRLGENFIHNVKLEEESISLEQVVVSAYRNPILNSNRTGASMNVSSRDLTVMPTINRSITDFTRLTPQANGNSFAGRDGRMNTITIDGSAFNNNFGLSSNVLPGGNAQPISLDAIEEVAVNIAPFDITMSQFTGASINAVTKSGTNTFGGSAYTYLRPETFTGEKVGDLIVPNAREKFSRTHGLTAGGPIIENKLFFFISGEVESEVSPSNSWEPSIDGVSNTEQKISRTTIADLQRVSNHLINTYGYNPGKYQDFDNFNSLNYKLMTRLDWNINNTNKFTLRYNDVKSRNDVLTNFNSGPSGLLRKSGRISSQSIAFQNSFYGFENKVRSIAGELNSKLSDKVSNKLLVTYTGVKDTRTSNSDIFPFVDIWKDNDQYMSFGYELFSYNNEVINNTLSFINNLTVNLGKHTITGGLSYDNMYFKNAYMREATSYYRYASVDDFINNANPIGFGVTYGFDGNDAPGVELSFGLGAAYIQDEYRISDRFKVTAGLRAEMPFYLNDLQNNEAISALTFKDGWRDGDTEFVDYKMDVGSWPEAKLQFSPRLGFNWDVKGDRSLQVRGGSGLFTGLLPFVWYTNQPNGSGMIQSPEIAITKPEDLAKLKFNPNYKELIANNPDLFPQVPGVLPKNSNIAQVDKNFKLPQVWRSNLAVDISLPYQMVLTLEALFSKDINAVMQRNVNMLLPDSAIVGSDNRPYWTKNKINSDISTAMVLSNSDKGYQTMLTAQLTKNFSNGLSGMVAYTYSLAKDVSSNPGSTAASAWQSNSVVSYLNNPELSYSAFAMPHNVVGAASYRLSYAKNFATTFSVYYSGTNQGRTTYTYSNDLNNDGYASDLMYIPKSKDDIQFIDVTKKFKDNNGVEQEVMVMTKEEQADALWQYIENDSYLSNHKGEYAERFGGLAPWLNRFDVKIIQDIFSNFGTDRRYTLQASLDILNVGNLINSAWGVYKTHGLGSYDRVRLLTQAKSIKHDVAKGSWSANRGLNPDGTVSYILNAQDVNDFNKKAQWSNSLSTGSTWGMLLGIKLLF